MKVFKTLLIIHSDLADFLQQVEKYFSIEIDSKVIRKIIEDAEADQVNEKNYVIFKSKKNSIKSQLTIDATVDEYEPESIWIKIENLEDKDVNYLKNLVGG